MWLSLSAKNISSLPPRVLHMNLLLAKSGVSAGIYKQRSPSLRPGSLSTTVISARFSGFLLISYESYIGTQYTRGIHLMWRWYCSLRVSTGQWGEIDNSATRGLFTLVTIRHRARTSGFTGSKTECQPPYLLIVVWLFSFKGMFCIELWSWLVIALI